MAKVLDRPMLRFCDLEEIGGVPNKIFPLVIVATVGKFGVSRILIDGESFYDIMYSKLFKKMGLNISGFLSYKGSYVEAFNGITTCQWGYVELKVSVGD